MDVDLETRRQTYSQDYSETYIEANMEAESEACTRSKPTWLTGMFIQKTLG